jgi:hypothetical protein
MIQLIDFNEHRIFYTVFDDPDRPEVDRYSATWTRVEFQLVFGITIPAEVSNFHIENHRGLYGKMIDRVTHETFANVDDDPLISAVWAKRELIRKHAHAQVLSEFAGAYVTVIYDEPSDSFSSVDDPDKDHKTGLDKMYRRQGKMIKHFVELMQVLQGKGILTASDLTADLKNDIQKFTIFRDSIDWNKFESDLADME